MSVNTVQRKYCITVVLKYVIDRKPHMKSKTKKNVMQQGFFVYKSILVRNSIT